VSRQVKEASAQYSVSRYSREGGNPIDLGMPPGYKQTEVGVIPEEWGVSDIQTISSVPMQNGLFYEPARKGKGKGIINVGDLYKAAPIDLDLLGLFDATDAEIKTFKAEVGDLFFTRSSIVPSGIAHCNIYYSENDQRKIVFDSHLIRVRVNSEVNDPRYVYLACLSRLARKHLIGSAKTATMTTIDQGAIKKCPVLIPFKNEQTAIANALSDVDILITSLEKLIAKKRAIKTAAMQQLLTGKKRLPPFDKTHTGYKQTELGEIPVEWEVKSFSRAVKDVIDNRGKTPPLVTDGFPMVEVNAVYKQGKKPNLEKVTKYVSEATFTNWFRDGHPESGNILVVTVGSAGETSFVEKSLFCIAQNLIALKILDTVDSEFLFYVTKMRTFRQQVDAVLMGGVQPSLKVPHLLKFNFLCPKNKMEQKAIANVLSDMDSDIDALYQQLKKNQQLKQGMMQELLTGRTRLI